MLLVIEEKVVLLLVFEEEDERFTETVLFCCLSSFVKAKGSDFVRAAAVEAEVVE